MGERKYRVAVMFAGDPGIRATVKLEETRFGGIAKALRDVGLDVEAACYADDVADEVREQLLGVDGVLVWVDPVRKDGNRAKLDPMLRDVASHGVFVSSHPDLILKMGTKEVLYLTRNMSWGAVLCARRVSRFCDRRRRGKTRRPGPTGRPVRWHQANTHGGRASASTATMSRDLSSTICTPQRPLLYRV